MKAMSGLEPVEFIGTTFGKLESGQVFLFSRGVWDPLLKIDAETARQEGGGYGFKVEQDRSVVLVKGGEA